MVDVQKLAIVLESLSHLIEGVLPKDVESAAKSTLDPINAKLFNDEFEAVWQAWDAVTASIPAESMNDALANKIGDINPTIESIEKHAPSFPGSNEKDLLGGVANLADKMGQLATQQLRTLTDPALLRELRRHITNLKAALKTRQQAPAK